MSKSSEYGWLPHDNPPTSNTQDPRIYELEVPQQRHESHGPPPYSYYPQEPSVLEQIDLDSALGASVSSKCCQSFIQAR